ncbi:aromatic ring-hydroxylating dioxygenase subunit alpha [Variovorax dokdonensis]|uniref:Aromatic ring-hydroxylating dioxygenase subunit alpha n=1 Tax=Variovorax dokdonensis TaxID=344883 RepID=A0ABT7N536_9BURK|nr:aromatic ring-hydroxylating dioxygenase subunit alpha [Variovorax dokdonensis]MDM0043047.1 aromatic ring-hydroxylating dioxygenase subunit alpha [Variovorax dokdonensis]
MNPATAQKVIPIAVDTGTAYGRQPGTYNAALTEVGAGTPMGELLRRYWHPIGLAGDATDTPRKVRVLGEDLILFRDKGGRPGLVHPNCAHRGASLYYGKVEERGIRCCYHGWLFDVEGHCVEQPCEPEMGRARGRIRQPWYPVQELYGLVWAYLGPPEKKPILPRYDALERLDEGEIIETNDASIGGGGPQVIPCNWLQHYENLVDPFHVVVLHSSFSGTQFVDAMAQMPEVTWDRVPLGVRTTSIRRMPDGKVFRRISQAGVPTLRVIPSPRVGRYGRLESLGWILPIDDHSFRIFVVGRVSEKGDLTRMRSRMNGKLWEELTEEEHQRMPGDYEAMVSQGPIALHSEEHLATSDRGIVMLRRFLKEQLECMKAGGDPAGVSFDPDAPAVVFDAGNYLEDA